MPISLDRAFPMRFPPDDVMTLLVAIMDGGRLGLNQNGIDITLPKYPNHPQPVDGYALQQLEDRGWVVIAETVTVTEQGRYAADRYCTKVFGRAKQPYELGVRIG